MVKDWDNLTPEDWDEIVGGIKQFEKDFPPVVEKVIPNEAQKAEIARIMAEVERKKQEEDNMALENRNGRLVEVDANGEPVKGHKEPWEKFLTKDEFWRLPDVGRKMAEY